MPTKTVFVVLDNNKLPRHTRAINEDPFTEGSPLYHFWMHLIFRRGVRSVWKILVSSLFAFFVLTLAQESKAQNQMGFGGCFVGSGFYVPSIEAPIDDIAVATLMPDGSPVIYYNPQVVSNTIYQTQIFFYYHECAHHIFGHSIGMGFPLQREQEADCWAIQTLVARGIFSPYDLQLVQSDLSAHARADWTHLPGPQRAINLQACLGR